MVLQSHVYERECLGNETDMCATYLEKLVDHDALLLHRDIWGL